MKGWLLVLVSAAAMLAGCASRTVSLNGPDWSMDVTLLGAITSCTLGRSPITLTNRGTVPRNGGLWTVTLSNEAQTITLGEILVSCPTTFPGGSAACQPLQTLAFTCQKINVNVRG